MCQKIGRFWFRFAEQTLLKYFKPLSPLHSVEELGSNYSIWSARPFLFRSVDVFSQKHKHLQRTDGHVWLVFDFSSKFWRKLRFVESLKVLAESIKLDNVHIPPSATLWVWHVQFWFLQRWKFFLLVLIFMIYCKKDEACSRIWTCDNTVILQIFGVV